MVLPQAGHLDAQDTLQEQVKAAIVRCLRMPIGPADIQDDMLLFGDGLGLDSIDALEIVLELQRSFAVVVTDEQMGQRVLRSVRTIVDFIEASRRAESAGA
jgi:acyl carrier protein